MIASLLKRHEPLLSRPRHCVRQSARQIVIAAALGSLIAAPAGAAEVAQQWSGFHIGANVGYSAGSIATSGNFLTTSGPLVGIGAGSFVPPLTFPGDDRKYSTHGPLGGLQAGYDRQFGKFVAGAEADFQLADLRGSDTFDATVAGPHYSSQTKTNWLVTVRGRLGYAFAGFLPYVTGGLAAARATSSLAIQGGTQSAPQGPPFEAAIVETSVGYAVGGGIEFMLAPSWSVKAEYLHVDLGSADTLFNYGAAGSAGARAHSQFDVVRAGVNFHL